MSAPRKHPQDWSVAEFVEHEQNGELPVDPAWLAQRRAVLAEVDLLDDELDGLDDDDLDTDDLDDRDVDEFIRRQQATRRKDRP